MCARRFQVTFVLLTLALAAVGRGRGVCGAECPAVSDTWMVSRRRALADAVAAPGSWPSRPPAPVPVSGSPQPLRAPSLQPLPSIPQGLSSHSSCFLDIKGCVLPEFGRNSSCWFVECCSATPQPPAPSELLLSVILCCLLGGFFRPQLCLCPRLVCCGTSSWNLSFSSGHPGDLVGQAPDSWFRLKS